MSDNTNLDISILERAVAGFDFVLTDTQKQSFLTYYQLLIEWNSFMNLTAITDFEEVCMKHFADSLSLCQAIDCTKPMKVIDIGTGAGFPGIPITIYRDDINVTLVDSLNKRINFLNIVIEELKLEKIKAIHSRAEEFGKNVKYREKFDVSTSRAVANLATLSEYLIPLIKQQGKSICMKGSEIEEELNNSKKAIKVLGGKILKVDEFTLPNSDIKRNIIVIKKVENTPAKYPRKPGIPAKEPIS